MISAAQSVLSGIYDAALDAARWTRNLQSVCMTLDFDSGSVQWAYDREGPHCESNRLLNPATPSRTAILSPAGER
jgi:hypothetical protein